MQPVLVNMSGRNAATQQGEAALPSNPPPRLAPSVMKLFVVSRICLDEAADIIDEGGVDSH